MGKRKTKEEWIEEFIEIYGDKYLYNESVFVNGKTIIKIYCKKCEKYFLKRPDNHKQGQGCTNCVNTETGNRCRKTTENFINNAIIKHGNKFNYSEVDYTGATSDIIIKCPIHGRYLQNPRSHLKSEYGCPKCGFKNSSVIQSSNTDKFINDAVEIHGNKYDYSKVKYINAKTKVIIICPKHGEFKQTPDKHIYDKNGCPKCKSSKGESRIEKYLFDNNIKFVYQKKFIRCVHKKQLPFDFYLPDFNICIEFNGMQHYKPIKHFGGDKAFKKQKLRDSIKTKYCEDNGIKLIRIPYTDLDKIEEILKTEI